MNRETKGCEAVACDLRARRTNTRSPAESSMGDALQSLVTDVIFHGRRTNFKASAAERAAFLGELGVRIDTEKTYRRLDLFAGALGRAHYSKPNPNATPRMSSHSTGARRAE